MKRAMWLTVLVAVLLSGRGSAQSPVVADVDHAVVFELGWEGDWAHAEGLHSGGTFAFEVTPIEQWLELECGVSAIHESHGAELSLDLLFKKPWQITRRVEFMAGIGPALIHSTVDQATFWGLSAVADLMVWPSKHVGWYLEPGVERTFREGEHRNGLGMAAGLIIGR
jgi:hypothetical protein